MFTNLLRLHFMLLATMAILGCSKETPPVANMTKETPNIIIILADDMGYGDVSAYNSAPNNIPTPSIDQLANEGVKFTDAHTSSSVCSPSRYSILTGEYAWRTRLKAGVLWGHSPALISNNTDTIGKMLQRNGYHTAAIGKWHLGMGGGEPNFYIPSLADLTDKSGNLSQPVKTIRKGPNEAGFDYFYGIPASLDMPPYVYIENGVPVTPINDFVSEGKHLRDGGTGQMRKGPSVQNFDPKQTLTTLTNKALEYIGEQAKHDAPFFLYFSLTAPHAPWLPEDKFKGQSTAGHYGDFVLQVDDVVGQVSKKLASLNIDKDTLIIFTADNGAQWIESDKQRWKHNANGQYRGQKADIHEGGHRVPFIAKWPKHIETNMTSHAPMNLTDLMRTMSDMVGDSLPTNSAKDSYSFLPNLLNNNAEFTRPAMVHHSADGMFALRENNWKLIEGLGSGGFTKPRRIKAESKDKNFQLYDLEKDPTESNNVAEQYPQVVENLSWKLDQIRESK